MKFHALFLAAAICATTTAANADEGSASGNSSSGSVNVSVYIPPIGATLRAAQEGAVGLWSVSGRNNGLLLKLNQEDSGLGYSSISVYSRAEVGVVAHWEGGETALATAPAQDLGGLNKTTYRLSASPAAVRKLTISGL